MYSVIKKILSVIDEIDSSNLQFYQIKSDTLS